MTLCLYKSSDKKKSRIQQHTDTANKVKSYINIKSKKRIYNLDIRVYLGNFSAAFYSVRRPTSDDGRLGCGRQLWSLNLLERWKRPKPVVWAERGLCCEEEEDLQGVEWNRGRYEYLMCDQVSSSHCRRKA
jgi:hypothetical protein